jgi:hypothetical protein
MGVLTPRKVTVRHQLVVPLSSSYDDLPLVKHDAQVDLNPSGARIHHTQEPALMSHTFAESAALLGVRAAGWSGVRQGVDSQPRL